MDGETLQRSIRNNIRRDEEQDPIHPLAQLLLARHRKVEVSSEDLQAKILPRTHTNLSECLVVGTQKMWRMPESI